MAGYSAPRLIAQGAIADVTLASICVVKTPGVGDNVLQQGRQVGQPFPCDG
jgi:uncharacterized protein (DUF302 family)